MKTFYKSEDYIPCPHRPDARLRKGIHHSTKNMPPEVLAAITASESANRTEWSNAFQAGSSEEMAQRARIRDWLVDYASRYELSTTVNLKHGNSYKDGRKIVKTLMNILDSKLTGQRNLKHARRTHFIAFPEGFQYDTRPHYHLLMHCPSNQCPVEFELCVRDGFKRLIDKGLIDERDETTIWLKNIDEGFADYVSKECLEHENWINQIVFSRHYLKDSDS